MGRSGRVLCWVLLLAGCDAKRVIGPPPLVQATTAVVFTAPALVAGGCSRAPGAPPRRRRPPPPLVQATAAVVFPAPAEIRASDPNAPPGTSFTCQPTIGVSVAGPVGVRLSWTGMGLHIVDNPPYDETFDLAFVQRFWAGDGLATGEAAASNSMAFGTKSPWLITLRLSYRLTGA